MHCSFSNSTFIQTVIIIPIPSSGIYVTITETYTSTLPQSHTYNMGSLILQTFDKLKLAQSAHVIKGLTILIPVDVNCRKVIVFIVPRHPVIQYIIEHLIIVLGPLQLRKTTTIRSFVPICHELHMFGFLNVAFTPQRIRNMDG